MKKSRPLIARVNVPEPGWKTQMAMMVGKKELQSENPADLVCVLVNREQTRATAVKVDIV